ncbi:hypothetical protein VVD49_18420 [Uliginosibacterium sp. H3]|uniref:DUF2878 domain-containing protein n=1 Tax=Uliginosibacterium silvisoli TaxID=3114758 RepID=A0ABU6K742_9RHOO|nr:hypothetical protein [Uliginosibacterium sp. H3]
MSRLAQNRKTEGGRKALLYAIPFLIGFGALVDQYCTPWGQPVVSLVIWLAYVFLLWIESAQARPALVACLVLATLGEMVLSLVWGLYDYRLQNIPLFVPPGHVLLFWFGLQTVARVPGRLLDSVLPVSGVLALVLALASQDGLSIFLWAMFLACRVWGSTPRFYAWMFVIALIMEVFATQVGNWHWQRVVPILGLPTTNPPLAAGAFYCVLDVLVLAVTGPAMQARFAGPWRLARTGFASVLRVFRSS